MTSIYHFLFVPLTLGLAPLIAVMQTCWHRTGDEAWLRLTRFFGTLLLINFAIGVATGLVQEFQFGMNWSVYSEFVGGVFGAPLAIEGLAAFALEATFLGLWVFGWDRLSPRVHLATIWLVAIGTWLSAYFILVANSWMQRPVGSTVTNGEATLTDVWALITNRFALYAFTHTMLVALTTGSLVVLGIACWHLARGRNVELFRRAAALALIVAVPVTALNLVVGSRFGLATTDYQPMKIAAAEALWNTEQPAGFSLFQIGGFSQSDQDPSFVIQVPRLLSVLATGTLDGKVDGLNQVQAQYEQQYGRGELHPAGGGRVLGDARDGLRRHADVPRRGGRRLALPQAAARARALVHAQRDGRDRVPVHRRHRRLDPHRDGPPAVDRPGAAPDRGRALAERQRGHDRDEHRGVRGAVRGARRRRHRPDAALRARRPARRRAPARGAGTRDGALR